MTTKYRTSLTLDEQTEYINSTLCLMNLELAPAKTGTYGSKSRWDELLVSHVAQVQFIHVTVHLVPTPEIFLPPGDFKVPEAANT